MLCSADITLKYISPFLQHDAASTKKTVFLFLIVNLHCYGEVVELRYLSFYQLWFSMEHHKLVSISVLPYSEACLCFETRLM